MRAKTVLLSSLILLLLVVASINLFQISSAATLWDWLSGKAAQNENLSIEVVTIQVNWVSDIASPQNVTENGQTDVTFYFTGKIPNGQVENIDDTTARANFTRNGEEVREDVLCDWLEDLPPDTANYSCTIPIWYWDGAGTWSVTAAVADINGNWAKNDSTTFNLSESTCFAVSPSALTWPTVIPGSTNQASNNDPSLLNNTCNDDIPTNGVQIKALDLIGQDNAGYSITAENFTAHIATGGAECTSGTSLVNATYTAVTDSILTAGNNSKNYKNETSGQEQLYYCVPEVNAGLIAQTYSTSSLGSWKIQI